MSNGGKISIVIPLLNEAGNIEPLYEKLVTVLKPLNQLFEIIFVDDGSNDKSFEIIKKLSFDDERISGISLSRNFGHQVALMAGIKHATGDIVITMDADHQHPPEVIPQLLQKFREGFDIVNTRRLDTQGAGWFKRRTSNIFYSLLNKLSDVKIEASSADFRLMNRSAVNAFLSFEERDRFTRGLVGWMGFRQAVVEYVAPPRLTGKTKYSLQKMIRFGLDGLTSFSSKPLRISFYTGIILFIIGIVYMIYAIVQHILGHTIPGWTSILVTILIIGGFQLLVLGIIGEYLARIFNEAKARPLYFIKDKTGRV